MASIEEAFEFALSRHQSGQLDEAEIIYQRVLEAAPGHAPTLFYAGVLAVNLGRIDVALSRLTQAAGAAPSFADAHYNLGVAFGLSGRREDACACYKRVLALDPAYTGALTNLGLAALDDRDLSTSINLLTYAVRLDGESASAWFNLGRALREADRLEESRLSVRRSLALAPQSAAARNAAKVLKDAAIRRHLDAGFASLKTDNVDEQAFQAAYLDGPDYPLVWVGFALARRAEGAFDAAVDAARKAAALDPLDPFPEHFMGQSLRELGRCADASLHLDRVTKVQPENAESWLTLSRSCFESGDAVQSFAAVRRAATLDPLSEIIRDTLLFTALACPEIDNAALAEETEAFRRDFGRTLVAAAPAVRPKSDGRLRIGYISGGISEGHNALYFLEPLLRHHDRTRVSVCLYGDVAYRNPAQTRLTAMVDGWFDTTGLNDEAVAAQIRADGVDVLIGLLGRGSRHPRVEIFKRRPAPVQIAFHHVMSTGIDAVDYWLTDLTAHPRDTTERFSERLIRLPRYCQYQPPWVAPEPSPPPALNNRYVTFGSFTSRWKISDPTLGLWARILKGSPGARLLLKGDGLESEAICDSFRRRFEQNGGDAAFLDFRPADRDYIDHLAAYGDIDIALDTWPYSYGNTGFEALWMGVPVVTLAGDRFAGRMGAAILTAAGLSRWVADTPDAYVAAASALAEDQDQRTYWRSRLRDHLRTSRLLNGRAYARHVERVCRWAVARL